MLRAAIFALAEGDGGHLGAGQNQRLVAGLGPTLIKPRYKGYITVVGPGSWGPDFRLILPFL